MHRLMTLSIILVALSIPSSAQILDLVGGRGNLQVRGDGTILLNSNRGNSMTLRSNQALESVTVPPYLEPQAIDRGPAVGGGVVVKPINQGQWLIEDHQSGDQVLLDLKPGGWSQITTRDSSITLPTSVVRDYFEPNSEMQRVFEALERH